MKTYIATFDGADGQEIASYEVTENSFVDALAEAQHLYVATGHDIGLVTSVVIDQI